MTSFTMKSHALLWQKVNREYKHGIVHFIIGVHVIHVATFGFVCWNA